MSLDLRSGALTFVTAMSGLAVLLLFATALALARPGWIGGVLGLLALLYFGHILVANNLNIGELGLVSVALLVAGELAQWSIDGRHAGRHDLGIHLSRAAGIAWLALLGVGTVVVTMLAAGLSITASVGTVATAVAASVALLGLISFVALQRPGPPDAPSRRDAS